MNFKTGGKTLSMVATSSVAINPSIPEAQALTQWYESVKDQPDAVISLRSILKTVGEEIKVS